MQWEAKQALKIKEKSEDTLNKITSSLKIVNSLIIGFRVDFETEKALSTECSRPIFWSVAFTEISVPKTFFFQAE